MSDYPVIFSAPMVRALLDGRKTMARRLAWRMPKVETQRLDEVFVRPSPWQKVVPGDRLWVRENFARATIAPIIETINNPMLVYAACDNRTDYGGPWSPSIHMPRRFSRLTLVVTATKVERLQDISEEDAKAEGVESVIDHGVGNPNLHRIAFEQLWERLHGACSWYHPVDVVALTFTVHKTNIDQMKDQGAMERMAG